MLNFYKLNEQILNYPKMPELASKEEFLGQWELLRSSMVCPEQINLQLSLNSEMTIIIKKGKVLKNKPMPFYHCDWEYTNREWVKIQPRFEAVSLLIRINNMPLCSQDKMALSQFVLWVAQKYYPI